MLHIPASDFFQPAINGPLANRPLIGLLHYIDEACFLKHVLDEWRYHHILPKLLACFDRKFITTFQYVARSDRTVIGSQFGNGFALLDVAAWGDMAGDVRVNQWGIQQGV